ncbi:phosphatidylserine decarboxylase [Saccharomonospora viridis]|jgi:phosphatidylserine decarboxylase|uniref:Phosphatidylserine decarboxylase proenzyme n=2 Tax=Saccharomonospora viridis TaxID=1852 RepID=C7MPZ1_SACVD|nr:phosphatidylserine decarboxylase [Saccharomonospora viridis]ACU98414.1 phosphatidylserine decarboxylase precursor-related protein [Saccharomonospora viridis DSM 43017]KHF44208.1 phosphatidylserine decarboxylase [Saccharomonospora viridis]SFP59268.1 phosphatidylserine decarboxylase [Saccharomonospora viridis]
MSANSLGHAARLIRETLPPIHPAGRPFIAGGVAATLLLRKLSPRLGLLAGLGTLATAAFFREPRRVPPLRDDLVLSAADGVVSLIEEASPPAELGLPDQPLTRVSVFLSVFDVHVQRMPVRGTVEKVAYRPGKFLSADLDKASEDNERNSVLLRTASGQRLVVVQIAGLVARRIVCQVGEGEHVEAGSTYGLIRFGSRVDTYLPPGSRVLVREGQRTIGGETPLAELEIAKKD